MPRYEYRVLNPVPVAEKAFLAWIDELDRKFENRDPEHRSDVVRESLSELYLGRTYAAPDPASPLAIQSLVHSFDPRNITLEAGKLRRCGSRKVWRAQAIDLVLDDV